LGGWAVGWMEAREEARGKSARQKMGEMERDGETNKREPSGDRYQPGRVSIVDRLQPHAPIRKGGVVTGGGRSRR
jgi:hypothetical protein